MIKHIVLFKLKEVAEGTPKEQNARRMKAELETLKNLIPQLKKIEVGINAIPSDGVYDVALYSEFETAADLDAYQKHPAHLKVAEFVAKVREHRAAVDYYEE